LQFEYAISFYIPAKAHSRLTDAFLISLIFFTLTKIGVVLVFISIFPFSDKRLQVIEDFPRIVNQVRCHIKHLEVYFFRFHWLPHICFVLEIL